MTITGVELFISKEMAVGDATSEMLKLTARKNQYQGDLRFQVIPLSLLILALVLITGMAFFRFDFWLLGASFIAGGSLVVSALLYHASKRHRFHKGDARRSAQVTHLGAGTLSTMAGAVSLMMVTGDLGANFGDYRVFVAQIGFALMIVGGFWLVMTVRDLL